MVKKIISAVYPSGAGRSMSVREAKAHFSSLLEQAAAGEEITITWHGRPRARIVPAAEGAEIPLKIDREWLKDMKVKRKGSSSDRLIRDDRDARG
jgi:prevent-host-death family protein